jgi:hypothetical protein
VEDGRSVDQRLLLSSSPAFQLSLSFLCRRPRLVNFRVDDADWSPTRGVFRAVTIVVGVLTTRDVGCGTDIERPVRTGEDVDEVGSDDRR